MVIGVGNAWRCDDAAGIEVARRLAAAPPEGVRVVVTDGGDVVGLVAEWRPGDEVAVVDAASSGARPGAVHRFDAVASPLPARMLRSSTHTFGIPDTVEVARALGRLPRSLSVYAIEGSRFTLGAGLTPEVERAVEQLVAELRGVR